MQEREYAVFWVILLSAMTTIAIDDTFDREPMYVGTWASDPSQCPNDQSLPDAPLVLLPTRLDQHETHCKFRTVAHLSSDVWRARARCTVEGDRQRHIFTLKVGGNTLTLRDERGEQKLIRCG